MIWPNRVIAEGRMSLPLSLCWIQSRWAHPSCSVRMRGCTWWATSFQRLVNQNCTVRATPAPITRPALKLGRVGSGEAGSMTRSRRVAGGGGKKFYSIWVLYNIIGSGSLFVWIYYIFKNKLFKCSNLKAYVLYPRGKYRAGYYSVI
jgi:hypothetical protein